MRAVEVHPRYEQLQFERRMRLDGPERRAHQPELGARAGDETNSARVIGHWSFVTCHW
jgi:hypothetical protein